MCTSNFVDFSVWMDLDLADLNATLEDYDVSNNTMIHILENYDAQKGYVLLFLLHTNTKTVKYLPPKNVHR